LAATPRTDDATAARLMLVFLSIGWGVTWPIMRIALEEIPPLSMRLGTTACGAAVLFLAAWLLRRDLEIPTGIGRIHLALSGAFNVFGFSLFTAFAQLSTATSRVAILAYTMPIWSCLLARPVLGERLTANRMIALVLCMAGLAVLVFPLWHAGVPTGIVLATGAGVSWAAGTIYLKWARIPGDPIGIAAWQVFMGFVGMIACVTMFEDFSHLRSASWLALACVAFTGIIGSGIAYLLWIEIVQRLPAMTASLGVLSAPVIGVVASMLMLGERPTLPDVVGFALIFAASACVLIQPRPLKAAGAA
jgi:drug/metabolite transporter (DMT)-like permease